MRPIRTKCWVQRLQLRIVAMSAAVLWHENTLKNAKTVIQTLILFLTQVLTNTSSTKNLEDCIYVCCQSINQEV